MYMQRHLEPEIRLPSGSPLPYRGPMRIRPLLLTALLASLAVPGSARDAAEPTRVLSAKAAQRLMTNKGLTLQWVDWNTRGSAVVRHEGDVWTLRGAQAEAGGPGRLFLEGTITEIGADYFTFEGRVAITNTPDQGRTCDKTKTWHFAITQKRRYYRLREFEWCDGLTDYIDIHF